MITDRPNRRNILQARLEAAALAQTTVVTRRCEIYEQDATTLWRPDDNPYPRLIGGSIAINGNADGSRRTGNVVLENLDGMLKSHPGGFWYDKVIKLFRGVEIPVAQPKIIIIQDTSAQATAFKAMLASWGYTSVVINTAARTLAVLDDFDVIVALGGTSTVTSASVTPLLNSLYALGKAIYTNGNDNTAASVPLIATTQTKGTASPAYRIQPGGTGHYIDAGWIAEDESSDTGTLPITLRAGAVGIANMTFASTLSYTAIAEENSQGGRWFHYHDYVYNAQSNVMHRRAFDWLDDTRDRTTSYETQIGEFMIDEISIDDEPQVVNVKLSDYVKKCKLNGFTKATTFKAGQDLDVVVRALATNAGITKIKIGDTGKRLGRDFAYEPGTDRWAAMKALATAYGFDLYFDNTGTLVMPLFEDPAKRAPLFTFRTGTRGSLVSYKKTTNDTRLYNHIIVIGQASNQTPIYAEAMNTTVKSPTSIAEIGDRVYRYESSYVTSVEQAVTTAVSLLARNALEEFSVDLESIVIPWLEAGHVVDFIDPDPAPGDPTKFLLTDLTMPLGLGSMSGTAKRVRQVTS